MVGETKFGVLVLGYKRPDVLSKTLGALIHNSGGQAMEVFFALDGPKGDGDQGAVLACRAAFEIAASHFDNPTRLYSTDNRGLRRKVIESVSYAFELVDDLVVLEDDCMVGQSSLDFFRWGLHLQRGRKDIGAVSGTFLGRTNPGLCIQASRFSSWGWGTNKEVWSRFLRHEFFTKPLAEFGQDIRRLTASDPIPYQIEYRKIVSNLHKLDSWAISFDMFLRSEGLKSVKPAVNQVMNIGFGESATHTRRGSSLSIHPGHLDSGLLQLADEATSKLHERREARDKFRALVADLFV